MTVNPTSLIRKLVSLPPWLLAEIETYRFGNRIKTESEAIRRLLDAGLAAQAAASGPSAADLAQYCRATGRENLADIIDSLAAEIAQTAVSP